METTEGLCDILRCIVFKSYYVVWKLGIIRPMFAIKNSLNRTMQYETHVFFEAGDEKKKFKSYYVVWKHKIACPPGYILMGLNRTMQYGNLELFDPDLR